jgi:hypothetical protein
MNGRGGGVLGRRQILEQRGGALFERCGRAFLLLHRPGHLQCLACLQLAFGFDGGDRLGFGLGHRDFGGRAATPHRTIARDRDRRFGLGFGRPPALGRGGRLLLLALLALPAGTHQGHLLRQERRQVAADEDVHLLQHADELLARHAEFRRQIMYARCRHSLLQRRHEASCERPIFDSDRLHRRAPEPGTQLVGERAL